MQKGHLSVVTNDLYPLVNSAGDKIIFVGNLSVNQTYLDRVKRIWYLSPMRAAKVRASLRILTVSPEPSLLAHTSSDSRGTFRQKARSLAPLNGWACAVKICHEEMLEDTNSLDGAQLNDHLFGKELFILFAASAFRKLSSIYVFPFWF